MTSLRAQKKRATARSLADAAYTLATAHGFEAVTTDGIASKAGVSRRTFANYYANKHTAVVDGFIQQLGIPIWRPDDPVDASELPRNFTELIDATQSFVSEVFTTNSRIEHIQAFAEMVANNPALEPYIHAMFLEFQNSSAYKILAERFGEVKVSIFLGAVIGSLGGILRLVLGPLALRRHISPQREPTPSEHPPSERSTAPVLTPEDVARIHTHIDLASFYLRRGFADQ